MASPGAQHDPARTTPATPDGHRYSAEVAGTDAFRLRHQRRGSSKLSDPAVRSLVVLSLARGWSPETVAGCLVFMQIVTLSRASIEQLLRAAPYLLHRRWSRRHSPQRERIHAATPISQRSTAANERIESLHFESDSARSPAVNSA